MNNFWFNFSQRKDLSTHSLMNLEIDSLKSKKKFELEKKHISKVLDFNKFNNILDLGGGVGMWSTYFLSFGLKVSLVEKEKNFLGIAKSNIKSKNIKFYHNNVNDFHYRKNNFDIVFLSGVSIYLNDLDFKDLIKKIFYTLKPGGYFIHRDAYSLNKKLKIDKYSRELQSNYKAVYRTLNEYNEIILVKNKFSIYYSKDMYIFNQKFNKRKETRLRLNIYKK